MSRRLKAAVMLTAAVVLAFSGVAADAAVIDGVPPAKASSGSSSPRYHLRCWQDGKLILEEQHVSAPLAPDSPAVRSWTTTGMP